MLAAVLALASACSRVAPAPCCVDLLAALPTADIRPAVHSADAIQAIAATVGGSEQRALSAIVPSRVSVRLRVPAHAVFNTALAVNAPAGHEAGAGVAFSLGISDGRTYEALMERTVLAADQASWQPVQVDLRRYAGWQWSLFYRPSSTVWEIVFNSYPAGPPAEHVRALWAVPAITGAAQ